jgi:hypothetical protein
MVNALAAIVYSFLVSYGPVALFGAAGAISTVVAYATTAFLLNKALNILTPKPKPVNQSLEVQLNDAAADGYIIYGKVRCSGVNMIPALCSGTSGRYLHQVLALAIHEVDSFVDVYFNQDQIANANIGAVSGNSSDGLVSSGTYANAAWIRRYVGNTSHSVDYILNAAYPTAFTTDYKGRGIAHVCLQYDWGQGKTYTSGVPQVTFEVKGRKCYDPRLDSSPGANPTNPSYIAWTANPALCWADYRMAAFGFNMPSTDIDWTAVVNAANVCDAAVNIPGGGTNPRYTFNARISCNADPHDNEKLFIDGMMGKVAYSGGLWRVFAGAWRSSEWTIQKTDWVSIGAIQTTSPRDTSRFNGVATYYIDPTRNWQRVECFRRFNDTYKQNDAGERIWIEMDQSACTNEYEAQRKGEFLLRQSRNGIKVTGILPPAFMKVRTWDNVSLTFDELGWNGKTFTVSHCKLMPEGTVEVVLSEEQSTDWTDLNAGDYNAPSTSALPATNPNTAPSAPVGFSFTQIGGAVQFYWNDGEVVPLSTRYQLLSYVGSLSVPGSKVLEWDGSDHNAVIQSSVNSTKWWQVIAYSNSAFSAYVPSTYGMGVTPNYIAPSVPAGWSATINPNNVTKSGANAILTTDPSAVTVNNKTTPVYSWTNPNSANIKINYVGSESTTFTASGMAVEEYRSAMYWCNIVDGGNQSSLSVFVSAYRSSNQ